MLPYFLNKDFTKARYGSQLQLPSINLDENSFSDSAPITEIRSLVKIVSIVGLLPFRNIPFVIYG